MTVNYEFEGWNVHNAQNELLKLGCLPQHVTEEWTKNHYRWIVWKLASYERAFSGIFVEKPLTREVVLRQLMHRYECEYHGARRSPLQKVAERDDLPSRHMVLCVASINVKSLGSSAPDEIELELTDGWYSLWTNVDEPLCRAIKSGRIFVGQKLCIVGASLIGDSEPLPILEAKSKIRLKLSANSTKPAVWYKKLGYQRSPLFIRGVSSIHINGGLVPGIRAVIVRRYPLRLLETDGKNTRVVAINDYPASDGNSDELDARSQRVIDSPIEHQKRWTPFLRLKLIENLDASQTTSGTFFLTMWRPDENVLADLKEGHRVEIRCIMPSIRFSMNGQPLQLSSSSSTRYKVIGNETEKLLKYVESKMIGVHHIIEPPCAPSIDIDLVVCLLRTEFRHDPSSINTGSQHLTCFGCTLDDQLVFIQLHPINTKKLVGSGATSLPATCLFRNLQFREKDPRFGLLSFSSNDCTELEYSFSKYLSQALHARLLDLVKE